MPANDSSSHRKYLGHSCWVALLLSSGSYCLLQQVSKSREELLRQGVLILFEKPADQEDGGPVSQRTSYQS